MSSKQSLTVAISVVIAALAAGLITRQQAAEEDRERAAMESLVPPQRPGIGTNVHPVTAGPDRCLGCHVEKDDEALLEATVPGTCERCHQKAHQAEGEHPASGKVVEGTELPVGPNGEVVCDTCHDPHGSNRALLREKGLMTACTPECHEEAGIE